MRIEARLLKPPVLAACHLFWIDCYVSSKSVFQIRVPLCSHLIRGSEMTGDLRPCDQEARVCAAAWVTLICLVASGHSWWDNTEGSSLFSFVVIT